MIVARLLDLSVYVQPGLDWRAARTFGAFDYQIRATGNLLSLKTWLPRP